MLPGFNFTKTKSQIKYIPLLFSLLIVPGCRQNTPSQYISWYKEQVPVKIEIQNQKISAIEYPEELGWIAHYQNQLSSELLDSLNKNKPNVKQFLIKVNSSEMNKMSREEGPVTNTGNLKFVIDDNPALDTRYQRGIGDRASDEYILVFKTEDIKEDSILKIIDKKNGNVVGSLLISEVIIKNRKKLVI